MEPEPIHLSHDELETGLPVIRQSPADTGSLQLIVARPAVDEREILQSGILEPETGLVGDNWQDRVKKQVPSEEPFRENQLTLMNSRVADLISPDKTRWPLAGDQLYVDFDLSVENIPSGTQLGIGTAVIEVSALPHTGCKKFVRRFGLDAMNFVNSPQGRALNLRGINAKVIKAGQIRIGDTIRKLHKNTLTA